MNKLKSTLVREVTDYLILRLFLFIVGVVFLLVGLGYIFTGGLKSSYYFTVASTAWGIIILIYAIKKQIQINKKKK